LKKGQIVCSLPWKKGKQSPNADFQTPPPSTMSQIFRLDSSIFECAMKQNKSPSQFQMSNRLSGVHKIFLNPQKDFS
jgi:hypothetical protein